MPELLSSKIVISEEEPSIRGFPTLPTAVLAIEGIAERGPIATPTLVSSYEEYERYFGGLISGRQLALAVRAFFLNGGQQCYVTRTCHFTNLSDKTSYTAVKGYVTLPTNSVAATAASVTGSTTGPWSLQPGDTLVGSVDRAADQTATFNATGALVECATAETYDFTGGGQQLTLKFDRGAVQTVTFMVGDFAAPATATAEEVAAAINKGIYGGFATATSTGTKVTLTSDKKGTASYVQVTGGTANTILGFDTGEVAGTGNVANIAAVAFSEVEAIVEAAWTNGGGVACTEVGGKLKIATVSTGAGVYLQVQVSSSCEGVFGLSTTEAEGSDAGVQDTLKIWGKYPGAYANSLKAQVTAATSGTATEFNLNVLEGTTIVETFPNLTMDTTAERYVETIMNHVDYGSILVTAEDLDATGGVDVRRPANTSGSTLTTGNDGLTSLDDNDYIGAKAGGTGFYGLDGIEGVTLLACPDNTNVAVQKAMIAYCEQDKNGLLFAILDPAAGLSATGVLAQQTALGSEGVTEMAALYWPRLIIMNPSKTIFGTAQTITVCPSGYVAGIMATNDRDRSEGPFFQPAGTEGGRPYGVVALETDEAKLESKRDLVFPKRINPITYMRNYGVFVDGARTLKGTGNFPSIGERRGVSVIETQLQDGLQWVRHRNNTSELRASVFKDVYALLHDWMARGAFASYDPDTAYFVDVSDALNPPSSIRAGKLVMRIGMATNTPAEFIIIKVTKDTRAIDEELFGS